MSRRKHELIETKQQKTRCLVVHAAVRVRAGNREHDLLRSDQTQLDEILGLSRAINLEIVDGIMLQVDQIRPATFLKSGQVDMLGERVEGEQIDLVVVNSALSPIQQRNLEKALRCKVIDRTGLILEIFGARAATREGRMQVDLAHLTYQKSRLVRSWTHLERQRGGAGFLGGPGETQIEADRRVIDDKITKLKRQLEGVVKTRQLHRKARKKVPYPIVALVGYTNAGKSTLFNLLTQAEVLAKDQLFATLDPTMRQLALPSGRRVILSDTVGFISDLPTQLIAAFRATLEEVLEADVIVHVRDVSDLDTIAQRRDVIAILEDLGINPETDERHFIEVQNKIDLLDDAARDALEEKQSSASANSRTKTVVVSAVNGDGVDDLLDAIETVLAQTHNALTITVPPEESALAAWIHRHADVLGRNSDDTGITTFQVRISDENLKKLRSRYRKVCKISAANDAIETTSTDRFAV